ncbi:MAG TPA: PaaI family thioesterase [Thermoanaerobaculia bacterium]|nr:PaaI family thioesterase [Thermoanaerobaculia bacterium]
MSAAMPPAPPAIARLGAERLRWDPGHTEIRWRVPGDPRFGNTAGTVHGGYLCVIADSLLGSALSSQLPPERRGLNPDFHAEFLAPLPIGGTLIGEGRVERLGRAVSFLEATLRNESSGELLMIAQCLGLARDHPAADRARELASSQPARRPDTGPVSAGPVFAPDGARLPDWFGDLGARMVRKDDGEVEIEWPLVDHRFDNRAGALQGGYLCLVADAAMGFALISGIDDARSMSTTTLSLHFHRPVAAGATLRVHAAVDRRGRRFGFMRAVVAAEGRTVARARATGLINR